MTTGAADSIKVLARRVVGNPAVIYSVIFGLYLIGRLILIIGGHVFTSNDATTYAPRPGGDGRSLVSFVGNAPRPWGLPLFYAVFGSDGARVVAQWAVATLAWGYFAWEISRSLVTRGARYAVVAGILVLALLRTVTNWDLAILSESMSISLGLIVLAFLLRWLRTGSTVAIIAMTATATWWTFLRPDIRVFTVVLMVVLLGLAGRTWWKRRSAVDVVEQDAATPAGRRVGAALAACLVLGLGLAWYAAITPALERAGDAYDLDGLQSSPLPEAEQVLVYRLRVDVSTDPALWTAFKTELGMPTCPELEAFTQESDWKAREWVEAYARCPALGAWVEERKDKIFWGELAAKDPSLFVQAFLKRTSLSLGGDIYADVPKVVPARAEDLVFPSRRYGLPLALLGFGAAFGLAWWAGAVRANRRLVWFASILFGTAILSSVATIVAYTGEIQRFGMQETVATRIAIVILLACALDGWLLRHAARRSTGDTHETESAPRLD